MHPDKSFAEIQAQIDNGTLRYSPEVIGAIEAHARAMRALEMGRLIGRALSGLGAISLQTGGRCTWQRHRQRGLRSSAPRSQWQIPARL